MLKNKTIIKKYNINWKEISIKNIECNIKEDIKNIKREEILHKLAKNKNYEILELLTENKFCTSAILSKLLKSNNIDVFIISKILIHQNCNKKMLLNYINSLLFKIHLKFLKSKFLDNKEIIINSIKNNKFYDKEVENILNDKINKC